MSLEDLRNQTRRNILFLFATALLLVFISCLGAHAVLAEDGKAADVGDEINDLRKEIENKKSNIEHINQRIEQYKEKIDEQQKQSATLSGEIDLFENRIAKTELDIQAAEEEIDAVASEIRILDVEINELDEQLGRQRQILEDILVKIQTSDDRLPVEIFFGSQSFSELFDQIQYLENVNGDLERTLEEAKQARDSVLALRTEQEGKRDRLTALHEDLEKKHALGVEERLAREALLSESQKSEAQFSALLYALREEQTYIDEQVAVLQGEMESKLNELDDGYAGSSVMSWPLEPLKGISAYFHDPTYPFRHLFEHPGIDIPAPQGTVLKSAAPGYVAWVRSGRMYGNYVMIIHTNGLATLYGHLSSISVSADQFVTRGQIIGKTGGTPGTAGAGFSTGPHLHFEVRNNGIPVDPMKYLIAE